MIAAITGTSSLNWFGPNQTIANGYVTKLGADGKVQVMIVGGTANMVLDVLGFYVPMTDAGAEGTWLVAEEPERAYDSRLPGAGGALTGGQSRTVDLSALVPAGATAVQYTLTVADTAGAAHLSVGKPNEPKPPTSVINWFTNGQRMANSTVATVGADRSLEVFSGGGSTQFIVDVLGYFVPPAAAPLAADLLGFTAVDPQRLYDSRAAGAGGPISNGQSRTTSLADFGAVPASTRALAVNLTEVNTVGVGHLRLSAGAVPPPVSSINWYTDSMVLANGTLSAVAAAEVTTWAYWGSTDYLLDVAGYYSPAGR